MALKIDIENSCRDGRIRVSDFCELLGMRPRRTHFLDKGDYVVIAPVNAGETHGTGAVLAVEEIAELDAPEKGDFLTTRGTIGPVSGNVFIKIQKGENPKYLLIEGGRIGEAGCPTPVYDLVNGYVNTRFGQN